jgi:hypothetical protein
VPGCAEPDFPRRRRLETVAPRKGGSSAAAGEKVVFGGECNKRW